MYVRSKNTSAEWQKLELKFHYLHTFSAECKFGIDIVYKTILWKVDDFLLQILIIIVFVWTLCVWSEIMKKKNTNNADGTDEAPLAKPKKKKEPGYGHIKRTLIQYIAHVR